MEVRAIDVPVIERDRLRILFGEDDITSICTAFDADRHWADVVIRTKDDKILRDWNNTKTITALTVRLYGPVKAGMRRKVNGSNNGTNK